jgi:HK97 family phage portal protein
MRLSTVFGCVRVLSESFAVLPFCMYRPKAGGKGRTKVTDHWMVRLFTKRPNRFQNPFEWREMLQGHLVMRGNAYCQIVEDGVGGIAELLPLHPDRIKVEMLDGGSWRYVYSNPNGETTYFTRQEIWHIRGLSGDGVSGINPIEAMRDVLGAALGTQDYAGRFFANDAKPTGGWIEVPGTIADQAARSKLKESVQAATSGENRHKTMILDRGMKYHDVGLTNKDSQFLELRQFNRTEICAIWRVPPHMVGDLTRATFSNIEQQSIDFWMGTMLPWTERWEAAAEALLGDDDQDLEVEFDFRNLLRGDAASRASYIHNMVLDGVLTRNEGRELEGYDPIDGLDEPLVPINEQTLEESMNPPEPVSPATVDQPAKEQPQDGDENARRLAQLVIGNAQRMARRIADGQPPSAAVLADALAISSPLAASWLASMGKTSAGQPVETISASLAALGSTQ